MDVKRVALCKLVNVRKQLGTCHAAVGGQHRVGACAAHWQGCTYHMANRLFQRVGARAMFHRQVHADFRNFHIAHDTAHRELLGIRQGGGRSPSLRDGRAGQHGVVLLCGFTLCSQLGFVGFFNSGGVGGFDVRVVFGIDCLAD